MLRARKHGMGLSAAQGGQHASPWRMAHGAVCRIPCCRVCMCACVVCWGWSGVQDGCVPVTCHTVLWVSKARAARGETDVRECLAITRCCVLGVSTHLTVHTSMHNTHFQSRLHHILTSCGLCVGLHTHVCTQTKKLAVWVLLANNAS